MNNLTRVNFPRWLVYMAELWIGCHFTIKWNGSVELRKKEEGREKNTKKTLKVEQSIKKYYNKQDGMIASEYDGMSFFLVWEKP